MFTGSSPGRRSAYVAAAQALGGALAAEGVGLVYGGASVGLMGALADAALAAGGEVLGVLPRGLHERELAHPGLTRLEVVGSMHERKARMAELADGFVALPGGAGTLEELFEVWTWAQLGLHRKPLGLLDVEGFHGPLVRLVDHLVDEGFLQPAYRAMLLVESDPHRLLARFAAYQPPREKWLPPARVGT